MNYAPSLPRNLRCADCDFYIVVNARGAHGGDPGSGVEAAEMMNRHASVAHPDSRIPYPLVTKDSEGDPVEVRPSQSRAERQTELNGPSGSPTSPSGALVLPRGGQRACRRCGRFDADGCSLLGSADCEWLASQVGVVKHR